MSPPSIDLTPNVHIHHDPGTVPPQFGVACATVPTGLTVVDRTVTPRNSFTQRTEDGMKIGVSSYSFAQSFANGTMEILDAIDWVAASDATHFEVTGVGLVSTVATLERAAPAGSWNPADYPDRTQNLADDLVNQPALIADIRAHAEAKGVALSNYAMGANFNSDDPAAEVARVKQHLDAAHALGIPFFRHDVVSWARKDASLEEFEQIFAAIVPLCQEVADYGATLGITTSIENHGFFMNNSERVRRLIYAVDRPNFKTTLDIGNFLCVDELPESAVAKNLPLASVIHLKDFYVRDFRPGDGWLTTVAGNAIQGSIVGFGDLPMKRLFSLIKESGFDGPISIEFEGQVPDLYAIETSIANALRIWSEV